MYVEKYSARHCLRRNLAVHYAANNSVQHTQTPNTAANICVSLRGSAKNIPASPHTPKNTNKKNAPYHRKEPRATYGSRSEPIEKSAHDGCRVQTLLLVKECIIPCASHGESA